MYSIDIDSTVSIRWEDITMVVRQYHEHYDSGSNSGGCINNGGDPPGVDAALHNPCCLRSVCQYIPLRSRKFRRGDQNENSWKGFEAPC